MDNNVGTRVTSVGQCQVMKAGERFYVLDPMAREIGDCASREDAMALAVFVDPETCLAQEFAAIDQAPVARL